MSSRVKKSGSIISVSIDWYELVLQPQKSGYYAEAFAMADAIIDHELESLLRQIYSNFRCQDLINEIELLRGKIEFYGLRLAEILKNKTVINEEFLQEIREFKKARNIVGHSIEREYALILHEELSKANNQEEYDKLAKEKANEWLIKGFRIFEKLLSASGLIYKKEDFYFSEEFFKENPRGELIKRNFPKDRKKTKGSKIN